MKVTADDLIQIAAAGLISGVILLFAFVVGNALYAPQTTLAENAYPVTIPDRTATAAVEEAPDVAEPIAPLLASADVDAGMKVARACGACHSFDAGGKNKVGPNLWNIVGATIAGKADFKYSNALSGAEGVWSYADLNAWLYNPKAYASGTSMSYRGVKDTEDRANLIAYLRSLSDAPAPLPAE